MVWPCHEERRRVNGDGCNEVMKGKRPRGRPRLRWLDNIDSQLKGKRTSLKEVLETNCFENRKDWRTFISYSTDRSSGEDPWTPTWSMVSSLIRVHGLQEGLCQNIARSPVGNHDRVQHQQEAHWQHTTSQQKCNECSIGTESYWIMVSHISWNSSGVFALPNHLQHLSKGCHDTRLREL